MKTYWIRGGTVVDGTGRAPYGGDIWLMRGRISLQPVPDAEEIDARGLIVAPGFIDIHRHADFAALSGRDFGDAELHQGITTAVVGNCGLAPVPSAEASRAAWFRYIEPCLGLPGEFSCRDVPEYLLALDRAELPIHVGALCATGAVTAAVNGVGGAGFTAASLSRAIRMIDEAMEAGALGISSGLMYSPECFTPEDALVKMAEAAARRDGLMTCHIRVEGDGLIDAVDEILRIAGRAGVRLNISHFKATGTANFGHLIRRAAERVEGARRAGMDVMVDFYPYTSGATTILSLFPPGFVEEWGFGPLNGARELLRVALGGVSGPWDDMSRSIGFERIFVTSLATSANRRYVGMSLDEIAREMGAADGWTAALSLAAEEKGRVGIRLQSMAERDVDFVAQLPYSMLISDALYGEGDQTHPRRYGAFARFVREYVYEKRLLTLETAVRKMTALPAERLGLLDRGTIRDGYRADLVLLRPDEWTDRADYANSRAPATGVKYVFLEGQPAYQDNQRVPGARGRRIGRNEGHGSV